MLRHSPGPSGGRQSRTKLPALARSAARTASAARNSSILEGLVPSGTCGDQIGEVFHGLIQLSEILSLY